MCHNWILDVLTDLHAYASQNDLPDLAQKVEAALNAALNEIPEKGGADPFSRFRQSARGRRTS